MQMKQNLIFGKYSFQYIETADYPNGGHSYFYSCDDMALILDEGICKIGNEEEVFSYSLITDKQNQYVAKYKKVYRFLIEDYEKIEKYLNRKEVESQDFTIRRTANREEGGEVSPLEYHFEKSFGNVYGNASLKYLSKEYGICDENGRNYFLDYLIHTKNGKVAVEENGVTYHHPQIIGIEKYRIQLVKQNTCTEWGIRLFRFSTEDCKFEERLEDDISRYFGCAEEFVNEGITAERSFKLYDHQTEYLEEIKQSRNQGKQAFLVVLPTAAGKSKIVEEDLKYFKGEKKAFKALILAPNKAIIDDWNSRIEKELSGVKENIAIKTYSYMIRNYQNYTQDEFDYIVVDEAHHAVAPMMKRMIQYFTPNFLIGLTATDERLDNIRLESVFGAYKTKLSLTEAMEQKIVATARAFRIETNVDLSEVRFNGKDYVNADLEKSIRVTSRNELIADVLKEYFCSEDMIEKQGIIFCVNIKHAQEMERVLNEAGISARAVASSVKNCDDIIQRFKKKEFRFLCSCNMISEGWDYPELGILVMARPTMSKVLYTQQLGRGLRKTTGKEHVFVIDVVDQYGSMVSPCSLHSIFKNAFYVPFGDITKRNYRPGEFIEVDDIHEKIQSIMEIDINSFEDKYEGYISTEQLARTCYVSTGTVKNWMRKGKVQSTVSFGFGSKKVHLFSPEDVNSIMTAMNCKEHTEETIKEDFMEFIKKKDYTFSYKMIFMLSFFKCMNSNGEAKIDEVLDGYITFYKERLENNLQVDRDNCPYTQERLDNKKEIRKSMLENPFEKYERKRFMYYSKDLGMIALNHVLLDQLTIQDIESIKNEFRQDLREYYNILGGLQKHSL